MEFKNKRIISIAVLTFTLVIVVLIQSFRFQSWGDEVSVWVFDVGQGDAIFIDSDMQVLIDGGPSNVIVEKLSIVMPFWDRSIDLIVNTHPHADHLTGLIDVLDRYLVGSVWVSGQEYGTSFSNEFEDLIEGRDSTVLSGERLWIDEQVSIEVVWPVANLEGVQLDDPNDGSIVMLVECFETRILLTGDIGADQELAIMEYVGDIDILKVAHQGSYTSSHVDFLKAVDPEVAIISVGENDYGHPHDEVLNRLDQMNVQVYRTDLHGDIRVICSSEGYEIKLY